MTISKWSWSIPFRQTLAGMAMAALVAQAGYGRTDCEPPGVPVRFSCVAHALPTYEDPANFTVGTSGLVTNDNPNGGIHEQYTTSTSGWIGVASTTLRWEPGKVYSVGLDAEKCSEISLVVVPPPGYAVEIDGVIRTKDDFTVTGGYYSDVLLVRLLSPREAWGGRAGAASSIANGRLYWQVALGGLKNGGSAGALALVDCATADDWSSLFTPAGLQYDTPSTEIDVYRENGSIRQIIANEACVDVVTLSSTSYELRFYQFLQMQGSTDPRTFTGLPYVTYRVEQGSDANTLQITSETRQLSSPTDTNAPIVRTAVTTLHRTGASYPAYTWDVMDWNTAGAPQLVQDHRVWGGTTANRTESISVETPGGGVATQVSNQFQTFNWGEELTSSSLGSTNPVQTNYSYYTDPGQSGSYGYVESVSKNDGSWVAYQYYPAASSSDPIVGTIKYIFRPTVNGTSNSPSTASFDPNSGEVTYFEYAADAFGMMTRPTLIQTSVNGVVSSKAAIGYVDADANGNPVIVANGMWVVQATRSDWTNSGGSALTTVTKYYREDTLDDFYRGQPWSVAHPDGTKDAYAYQRGSFDPGTGVFTASGLGTGSDSRVAAIHGTTQSGFSLCNSLDGYTLDSVYLVPDKSTMTTTIRDEFARLRRTETWVWDGSAWQLVSYVNYDGYDWSNQLVHSIASNNAEYTAGFSGEQKQTEVNEAGMTVDYAYDAAGRVQTTTTEGSGPIASLATSYGYDAADRLTQVSTGSGETLTTSRVYDDAGRLTSESPPGLPAATYSYDASNRKQTVTRADGSTETDTYNTDGSPASVTGSGVVARYYSYGIESDGRRWTEVDQGTSTRNQKSWIDMLGRPEHSEHPGALGQSTFVQAQTYDAGTGQLVEVTRTGYAATRYQYDAMGQMVRSGLDIGNDNLALASSDRITDTNRYFEQYNNAWWLTTQTSVYPQTGSSASVQVSLSRSRLTGFPGGRISEAMALDAEGNMTDQTVDLNRSSHTATITTSESGLTQSNQVETRINGLTTSVTGFDGLTATIGYDSLDRPDTKTDPRGNTATVSYYSGSTLVSAVVDATSTTVAAFAYDGLGRRTAVEDAGGNFTYFAYTPLGQLWHQWGGGAHPVEYGYDSTYGDRTTMSTYRSGTSWSGSTWPGGTADTTTWSYDAGSGALVSKTDAAGKVVSFTYNERGQTATRVVTNGPTTTYGYDGGSGELTGVSYSDGTPAVGYAYTRLGQLSSVTDATGTRDLAYDTGKPWRLDAVALGSYFGGRVLTRLYTSSGVLGRPGGFQLGTAVGSNAELEQDYAYNAAGLLASVTSQRNSNGISGTFNYGYLANSDLVNGLTVSGNPFAVTRAFEAKRNLLTEVNSLWSGSSLACYDYTYNGLRQRATAMQSGSAYADYGASTFQAFAYDGAGELTAATGYLGGNVSDHSKPLPDQSLQYAYDPIGNRLSSNRTGQSGLAENYTTYPNNAYQTRENNTVPVAGTAATDANVVVGGSSSLAARQGNAWADEVAVNNGPDGGNPNGKPWQGTITVYANTGGGSSAIRTDTRTAVLPASLQSFAYDGDGNLTSDGLWDYQYDAENRLTRMATTGVAASFGVTNRILTFQYDYLGRRVQKRVVDGVSGAEILSRRYLYDGWNLVAEYQAPGGTGIGSQVRSYTWGLDLTGSLSAAGGVGGLLQIVDAGTGNTYFPAYDGNGNVAALVNSSTGALAATYEYDPFGGSTRATVADGIVADQPFRFSTKPLEAETGLVYFGHRYYSPALGRFINRDPIGESGGLNLYGFCGNDAIDGVDFLGNSWLSHLWNNSVGWLGKHIAQNWDHGRQYVIMAVAVVAAVVTYGALSEWAATESVALQTGMSYSTAAATLAAGGAPLSVGVLSTAGITGGIVGGAGAGFVAGASFAAMNGENLGHVAQAGLNGAISGVITGGVEGYYGSSFPISRIPATALASGVASAATGGKFMRGFEIGAAQGVLAYGWNEMRKYTDQVGENVAKADPRRWTSDDTGELETVGDIPELPTQTKFLLSTDSPQGIPNQFWWQKASVPSWLGHSIDRFVNDVSKVHDFYESWDYAIENGVQGWVGRGALFNNLYEVYGVAGMVPSGLYTAAALNPAAPYLAQQAHFR